MQAPNHRNYFRWEKSKGWGCSLARIRAPEGMRGPLWNWLTTWQRTVRSLKTKASSHILLCKQTLKDSKSSKIFVLLANLTSGDISNNRWNSKNKLNSDNRSSKLYLNLPWRTFKNDFKSPAKRQEVFWTSKLGLIVGATTFRLLKYLSQG
jgi:hypothetical protein